MNLLRKILSLLKRKKKSFVLDQKYKVVEAFRLDGVTYYQFDDSFQIPTGRAWAALTFYLELEMRCDANYLDKHTRAMDTLFSDPKKTNIQAMALLNKNLKERKNLAPFPEHIYKLASVVYFDENESPYNYEYKYGQEKIEKWKKSGSIFDFFLKVPLKKLIPSLDLPEQNLETYFQVTEEIDKMHQADLQEALSSLQ